MIIIELFAKIISIIKDQKKIVGEAISKRLYAELNDLVDEEQRYEKRN